MQGGYQRDWYPQHLGQGLASSLYSPFSDDNILSDRATRLSRVPRSPCQRGPGSSNSPSTLPLLEELTLYGTPHWDILFLMVKRRNITTAKGVNPIKSLTITTRCPKELTSALIGLLKGKIPCNLALCDLSINAISEIIKDPSISCDSNLSEVLRITAPQWNVTRIPDLPPYPNLEEDILSTWEDRHIAWMKDIVPNVPRVSSCAKSIVDGSQMLAPPQQEGINQRTSVYLACPESRRSIWKPKATEDILMAELHELPSTAETLLTDRILVYESISTSHIMNRRGDLGGTAVIQLTIVPQTVLESDAHHEFIKAKGRLEARTVEQPLQPSTFGWMLLLFIESTRLETQLELLHPPSELQKLENRNLFWMDDPEIAIFGGIIVPVYVQVLTVHSPHLDLPSSYTTAFQVSSAPALNTGRRYIPISNTRFVTPCSGANTAFTVSVQG
ncbi:5681_t:CDS:10, partial [Acaulospora colombiana]